MGDARAVIKWKHLRVRGENVSRASVPRAPVETPPRTRRKQYFGPVGFNNSRNTSAYAEKTLVVLVHQIADWKHLRVRGENSMIKNVCGLSLETPPRTRRKPTTVPIGSMFSGNTSAYAEKTERKKEGIRKTWKHLRVRGENYVGE